MKEEIKQQLENLLKAHDTTKKQKSEADAKRKAEQEGFLKEFSEIKMAVIESAMNEMGKELQKHGYNYQISKTGRRIDPHGDSSEAESISMILIDPSKSSVRFPTIVLPPAVSPKRSWFGDRISKMTWQSLFLAEI